MISKKFLKTKSECQVTFQLPATIADRDDVKSVTVVGEFNDWDESANPLRKTKGVWKTTLKLETDREFQYRFLVNGEEWHNDHDADKYVPNNVDGDNSVVVTHRA